MSNYLDKDGLTRLWSNIKSYVNSRMPGDDHTHDEYLPITKYGMQKVLWSGDNTMGSDQTITLSEAISAQPHGIVLVWGRAGNYSQNWNYIFVPKYHVSHASGAGVNSLIASAGSIYNKYCYITDTTIKGYTKNNNTSADFNEHSGINMSYFSLKYVLGV